MKKIIKTAMNPIRRCIYCIMVLLLFCLSGFSQNVSIRATPGTANPAAGLDIDFPSSGFLITRVALTGLSSFAPLAAHVAGMILYNTTATSGLTPGLYINDGTKWVPFLPPAGINVGDMEYWNGTNWAIISSGQPGQRLQLTSSGIPAWSNGLYPTLSTVSVTSITATSAVSGGNITSDGGTPVTARGVCWSTVTGPTIAGNKTIDGSGPGSFISSLTGLTTATTYYVRAYATNSSGTSYGNEVSFLTP